ncbi:cinnamoyl-CoA reductase [Aspergillus ellipticus CBS 707.79]|uniref:Cinnamoyl-CoA reductase n=1 Tax=Aspergillus ellipticus CBS 707.79 TaxID=1448320 RepID=A0A319CY15_9EURO|nr:cinnamoyl-CoA reductase [Aspergillus ellipticus CBS 707.79]
MSDPKLQPQPQSPSSSPEHPQTNLTIRALTRTPSSPAAQALRTDFPDTPFFRLHVLPADVYDRASLVPVFTGADALFAMTHNRRAGVRIETEEEMRHELVAGGNVVGVAEECAIPQTTLSALPNITVASQGRFPKVYHFDYKHRIEMWAREKLRGLTVLYPGLYYTNFENPQYCRRLEDGTVRFCAPCAPDTLADWVDPAYDIGIDAAETLLRPPPATIKLYPITAPKIPFHALPTTFTAVTGQPAVFAPISLDEWGEVVARAVGRGYEEDIRQMMQGIAVAPEEKICYGTMEGGEGDRVVEELGVRASSFAEWLGRTGWRGPAV